MTADGRRATASRSIAATVAESSKAMMSPSRISVATSRAASREHWLELPFSAAVDSSVTDGTVLEGVADLVYREDDGSLVIVDFKTDVGLGATSMDAYWRQLSIYANLIHGATREPVSALVLVFCRAEPAQVFRQVAVAALDH